MKKARIASLVLALCSAVHAGTSLTGIKVFSTDASGKDTGIGSQMWSSVSGGGPPKVWLIRGDVNDPFVNGPTNTSSGFEIPLTNGQLTFTIYAAPGAEMPYFGMNLFFNGEGLTPRISVFAPPRRTAGSDAPTFFANGSLTQSLNATAPLVAGAKSLVYVDGSVTVRLSSYYFALPAAFNRDRVARQTVGADGTADFIGQFTLEVTGAARTPRISPQGVVNAASFAATVAPGSLITLFGAEMAGGTNSASAVPLPVMMLNTSVTIAGKNMPLTYVSATQINAQVPYDTPAGMQPVLVHSDGAVSSAAVVQVVPAAPGIFQYGANRAVVQNEDYTVNAAENAARAGTYVIAYLTGCGDVDNAVPAGSPASADPLSRQRATVSATIGGHPSTVVFAGLTPGFVGLTQVNLQIPIVAPGTYPLVVNVNGMESNAAMITVK